MSSPVRPPLVVALGSTVMQDDGVGARILWELEGRGLAAEFVELGTDLLRLRLFFDRHPVIILLDALRGGAEPGSVLVFSAEDFQARLEGKFQNPHHLGVVEAVGLLKAVDERLSAAEFHLVGVVAETIDKGEELTPVVAGAVVEAANAVERLLARVSGFGISQTVVH